MNSKLLNSIINGVNEYAKSDKFKKDIETYTAMLAATAPIIKEKETVVGVIDDDLKALFIYGWHIKNRMYSLMHDVTKKHVFEENKNIIEIKNALVVGNMTGAIDKFLSSIGKDITGKLIRDNSLADFIKQLFYLEIRERYGLHGSAIGIREGWTIVSYDDGEDEGIKVKPEPPEKWDA